MDFPLITDAAFYAVAVPSVLLLGISKSGFGTGFGSLAVPLMALAVTVPQAAAIMMPLLFVMDVLGIAAFRREVDWKLLKFLIPWALVGTLIGTALFRWLDAAAVSGIVGAVTLLFLGQRLLFTPQADAPPPSRATGAVLTATAGFTSFIAHAGGPPIAAYMIPLKLKPIVYTATLSYLFFIVNLSKWVPYAWLGLLDMRNLATSIVLMPLAPLGVFIGVRMARRIEPVLFYRLVYLGMFLTGCKLLWDGAAPWLRS